MDNAEERARDILADHGVLTFEDVKALTALIRSVRAEEREACAKAAYETLAPSTPAPCDCIVQLSGGGWQQHCNCSNTGDLEIAISWCDDQYAAQNAAAAIRARGESDG